MDKKSIEKINFFLSGITERMKENIKYFNNITIIMKSGIKPFTAKIFMDSERLLYDFQGVKKEIIFDNIKDILTGELKNYDSAEIIYSERSTKIIIDASNKNVKMRHADAVQESLTEKTATVQSGRNYVVNPDLAKDLLCEIGILAKNGKIKNDKIRKYNQIDYFVELMKPIIEKIPADKEIIIMDCACGKSYLSFVMNFYICEILKRKCRFVGIDYSEIVINASRKTAKNLGYGNMEFIKEDLTVYTPPEAPDIVISLHACDTATDMAIALGIRAHAKAIVSVPCCHKDILKQYSYEPFSAVTKHGILKARLADTLTDALRASYLEGKGYTVRLTEYISPLETPKNIMIRAINEGAVENRKAMEEYNSLKELIGVKPAIERFVKGEHYGLD